MKNCFWLFGIVYLSIGGMLSVFASENPLEVERFNLLGADLGSGAANFQDVIEASDGSYIAVGFASKKDLSVFPGGSTPKTDSWGFVIAKFNANLELLQMHNFGESQHSALYGVVETDTGNFVAVGNSESDLSPFGGTSNLGELDAVLVEFNKNLEIQKIKSFGGVESDYFNKIIKISDGFVVSGSSISNLEALGGGDPGGRNNFLLVKFDKDLHVQRVSHWGGKNSSFHSVIELSEGGFIAVGKSAGDLSEFPGGNENTSGTSTSSDQPLGTVYDFVIARFSSDLTLEKINYFGGLGTDEFSDVIEIGFGEMIAVGRSYSDLSYLADKGGVFTDKQMRSVLARFDSNLDLVKINNEGQGPVNQLRNVIKRKDGSFLAAGDTSGEYSDSSTSSIDTLIVQFDEALQKTQEINLELAAGAEFLGGGAYTTDGRYVLVGTNISQKVFSIIQLAGGGFIDCGLRFYDGDSIQRLACDPLGVLTSPLRGVAMDGQEYGISLVSPDHADASSMHIQIPNGDTKALRILPSQ